MKKLLLMLSILFVFSCSKEDDNCSEQKSEIREQYNKLLENPNITNEQFTLISEERDKKIQEVCN